MSPLQNCVFRLYWTSTILRFVLKWLQQGLVDRAQCVSASTHCPVSSVQCCSKSLIPAVYVCVCVRCCIKLKLLQVAAVCVCVSHIRRWAPPAKRSCGSPLASIASRWWRWHAVQQASKQAARSSSKEEGRTRQWILLASADQATGLRLRRQTVTRRGF